MKAARRRRPATAGRRCAAVRPGPGCTPVRATVLVLHRPVRELFVTSGVASLVEVSTAVLSRATLGEVPVGDSLWGTWVPYFLLSGCGTFALGLLLAALRWPTSLSLVVGPAFGVALVWLVDRTDTPTTTEDRVVLIGACVIGSLLAGWVIPYALWVRRSMREEEQRLADTSGLT